MIDPLRSRGGVSEPRPVKEVVKAMRRKIDRFDEDRQSLFRENARLATERDAALACVRALEEGLRQAIAGFDRIAEEIDEGAGGVDWSDEVRAEAVELRALLTPAKEDGK